MLNSHFIGLLITSHFKTLKVATPGWILCIFSSIPKVMHTTSSIYMHPTNSYFESYTFCSKHQVSAIILAGHPTLTFTRISRVNINWLFPGTNLDFMSYLFSTTLKFGPIQNLNVSLNYAFQKTVLMHFSHCPVGNPQLHPSFNNPISSSSWKVQSPARIIRGRMWFLCTQQIDICPNCVGVCLYFYA